MTARRWPHRRWVSWTGAVVVVALLTGCSPWTVEAPRDGVEVSARFAAVEDLVPGHRVQIADVPVGAVTDVRLDGYEAVVTMRIERDLPHGTVASLTRTSLLGEDVVVLQPPAPAAGVRALTDGDELPTGPPRPGLELLTQRAVELLAAVSGDDLPRLVDAAGQVTIGREDEITDLVQDLATVTGRYADQRETIGEVLDLAAELADELRDGSDAFATLLTDVEEVTALAGRHRERTADTLRAVSRLARAGQGSLLVDTRPQLEATLAELGPVVRTFADDRTLFDDLLDQLLLFVQRLPEAVIEGEEALELYGRTTLGPSRGALGQVPLLGALFERLLELLP